MQVKEKRLTDTEIDIMALVITFDGDPFRGEGRMKIMEKLEYSSSAYSVNLKRLLEKGVLQKDNGRYHITRLMNTIRTYLEKQKPSEMVMQFTFNFNEK